MKAYRSFLILLFLSFLSLLLVCSGNAGTPKRGGTLIIGTEADPHGMDTHKDPALAGISILPQIYDCLINFDDEGNLVPGLARSMPEQPDRVTYIFTLRKGVKFHNGADFDAHDVKFSYDRVMNKEISHYWKRHQAMIESVEVLDPYKVKITLKSPYPAFLDLTAKLHEFQIVPRGSGKSITHPIGTGAFKFKEWIKDDRLILVKNEHYWKKGLPYLDEIIYKPFPEPTTRVLNLKTGKVDMVHKLPIKDALELKKNPRIKVIGRSGGQTEQLYLNTTKPPFHDKKVRQAIAYGIDRKEIVDSVFMGFAEVPGDLFPSWFWAHNPTLKSYPYNPQKAKALLKEAGYDEKNPLTFTITSTNSPIFIDQGVIVQAQLAKIGVKAEILPVEKSYWWDSLLGRKGRDYQASIEDFSDEMTDLQWIYRFFAAKSYYNNSAYNKERYGKKGFQNPEVERRIQEVLKVRDREKAREMWNEIQQMILDDAPMVYLAFYQNVIAMWDYVKNHKVLTRNIVPLAEVSVDK